MTRRTASSAPSFLVDHDAAAAERRRRVVPDRRADLVVVDHDVAPREVRDRDAEAVRATAALLLAVPRSELEAVVADAVDRAGALEPGLRSGDHQPLVGVALEVQVCHAEVELGYP